MEHRGTQNSEVPILYPPESHFVFDSKTKSGARLVIISVMSHDGLARGPAQGTPKRPVLSKALQPGSRLHLAGERATGVGGRGALSGFPESGITVGCPSDIYSLESMLNQPFIRYTQYCVHAPPGLESRNRPVPRNPEPSRSPEPGTVPLPGETKHTALATATDSPVAASRRSPHRARLTSAAPSAEVAARAAGIARGSSGCAGTGATRRCQLEGVRTPSDATETLPRLG